jgi:hypothetical protein
MTEPNGSPGFTTSRPRTKPMIKPNRIGVAT